MDNKNKQESRRALSKNDNTKKAPRVKPVRDLFIENRAEITLRRAA